MRVYITRMYLFLFSFSFLIILSFFGITPTYAEMSPRDGYVTTSTGAPVAGIKVVEYTDWCPPRNQVEQMMPGCPMPTNCHNERSTVTDANGRYYFAPMTPPVPSDNPCELNVWWRYTCSNPQVYIKAVPTSSQTSQGLIIKSAYAAESDDKCAPIKQRTDNVAQTITTPISCTPKTSCGTVCTKPADCAGAFDGCSACGSDGVCKPPACGVTCEKDTDCAGAKDGCNLCRENNTGQKVCSPPVACGTSCVRNDQCAGAKDGCTICGTGGVCQPPACGTTCEKDTDCAGAKNGCNLCRENNAGEKVCSPPAACGMSCVRDNQCAGAKDGCTTCGEKDSGEGKVCRPPAACGVACTKDSQCAGAKDGCTFCTAGKCSAFNPDMCSCDGIDFVAKSEGATFLPGDTVTFVAFGKVPGKDWKGDAATAVKSAEVKSMQFALYQSKASDPNNATRIAQSAAITPVVVENSPTKVRYKVTWDQKVPATPPPGTIYRVQATLKCGAKAGVLGVTDTVGNSNYFTNLYDGVSSMFARGSVLAITDTPIQREQQQATTFSPQAKILEKSCTIMRFSFD